MNERDYGPTHYQLARALARTVDSYLGEWLARHADLDILHQKKTAESRRKLEEVIDFSALPAATLAFDELREKLKALMPGDAVVTSDEFTVEVLGDRQMFVCGDRDGWPRPPGRFRMQRSSRSSNRFVIPGNGMKRNMASPRSRGSVPGLQSAS